MTYTREPPKRQRRTKSAALIASRLGISPRTLRRYVAESRADFLTRAIERRTLAAACRSIGYSYDEIAEVLQTSNGAARQLVLLFNKEQQHQAQQHSN